MLHVCLIYIVCDALLCCAGACYSQQPWGTSGVGQEDEGI